MLNSHRIMASGHDMCFWNWTLIFLLPEMFSAHTSLMCCLALAVFKSGWWSHFFFTFLNLRYAELLFQIWYQIQLQNHFAGQSFVASNWSQFLSKHFQFTIFVYLVRINVSFKDIWKRLSVCSKTNGSLMCQNIDGSSIFLFSIKFVHRQCYQIKCLEK